MNCRLESCVPETRAYVPVRLSLPLVCAIATLSSLGACQGEEGTSIFSDAQTSEGVDEGRDENDEIGDSAETETGGELCGSCEDAVYTPCEGGQPGEPIDCGLIDQVCVHGEGCLPCAPGQPYCVGNDVYDCDPDGLPGALVEECDSEAGEVCANGACANGCDVADDVPSNIGCEFWAVDLPNSRGIDDASSQPWGLVLANAGATPAAVIIERNIAALGEPENLVVLNQSMVGPGELATVELPRGELTGWTPDTLEPPGPTGTAKTNNGFRVTSTAPIVVYQFNTFTNDFSNDASLLLPTSGLGTVHRVIGYPTANPIVLPPPLPQIAGLPDRSSVTVVGTQDGTHVQIRPATTTLSDMQSIPIAGPGDTISIQLDKWQVVNISSSGIPGDMTGTLVESDKPVAVFSSGERAIGPLALEGIPTPPGWDQNSDLCCTDHIEEQVFPATALGSKYVITRSPERSAGGWVEPDVLRFMAVAEPASVTTSLPAPRDHFELQTGEMFETWTQEDIIVESSAPIMVAQILVSQTYTVAFIGDPALTYFPPVDQYRDTYVFLTPPTWIQNYFVLSTPYSFGGDGPSMGDFKLDGGPLPMDCVEEIIGELEGVEYWSIVCPVDEGAHTIDSDAAFGLTVYGYGPAGSYAYTGGADVKPIYDVPRIP